MQIKMAHQPNDVAVRPVAGLPKQYKPKQHHQDKSQPFDPDDLRRRLYIVLSEQNALKEKKQRARAEAVGRGTREDQGVAEPQRDAMSTKSSTTEAPRENEKSGPSGVVTAVRAVTSIMASSKENHSQSSNGKFERTLSKLGRDKPHRKPSQAMRQLPPLSQNDLQLPEEPYHHIPQEAAKQFARTATADNMRETNAIHRLSQQVMKFYVEGSDIELGKLDSSKTPAGQQRALRRAQSHKEWLSDRNQFQSTKMTDERSPSKQRHTVPGLNVPNASSPKTAKRFSFAGVVILEREENLNLNLEAKSSHNSSSDGRILEYVTPVDSAAANEHRVDWTQSDETQEKRGGVLKSSLLRKPSTWSFKEKFGVLKKQNRDNEKVSALIVGRVVGVESTTAITPNRNVKAPKLGFLARYRR